MRITLAKTAGFCFGVDRAVKMAYEIAENGISAATLGPLIHNTYVTNELAEKGVGIIDFPNQAHQGQTVIIRAHGIAESVYGELKEFGAEICDATCPFVKKIHTIVSENSAEDVPVLIAGDSSHPEVIGIMGYCRGPVFVFKNTDELEQILSESPFLFENRIIVVAQTTFSQNVWKKCKEKIKIDCTNSKIFDTICFATRQRQDEAAELSKKSDMMIIIGGRHSSNTVKLKAVCSENCETYLVERAEELKTINFSHCAEIGVTAGASTPSAIIKEVLLEMSEIVKETTNMQVEEVPSEAAITDEMNFSEA
ncbi:MAG: 4-hydroxy-3-methylbut-2-enyl diphosphate reductase, partial [Clostridia bacterium]|nr:4-hydroxy-3-methylbut-2-enyl diphosphate reductase [Clostridia bacterium]